jgi:hypothetical protein
MYSSNEAVMVVTDLFDLLARSGSGDFTFLFCIVLLPS